jgi:hypothetical protein
MLYKHVFAAFSQLKLQKINFKKPPSHDKTQLKVF